MGAHELHAKPIAEIRTQLKQVSPVDTAVRQSALFLSIQHRDEQSLRYLIYARAVFALRDRLAHFLSALEAMDLLSSTLIVSYSDHGESFGERAVQGDQFEGDSFRGPVLDLEALAWDGSAVRLPGHGNSLYQEMLHVPLLAWVPGQQGRDVEVPASLVDIYATVLSWLKIEDPQAPSLAVDLLDLAADSKLESPSHRLLCSSGIAYGIPAHAVRFDRWKLVARESKGEFELYDLEADPGEVNPLNGDDTLMGQRLRGLLEGLESRARLRRLPPTITAEQLERLRSLGYLSGVER